MADSRGKGVEKWDEVWDRGISTFRKIREKEKGGQKGLVWEKTEPREVITQEF